jgi:hypothetical protein
MSIKLEVESVGLLFATGCKLLDLCLQLMWSGGGLTCADVYVVAHHAIGHRSCMHALLMCQGGCSVNVRSIETALAHTDHETITYPRISSSRRSIHRDMRELPFEACDNFLDLYIDHKAKQVHQLSVIKTRSILLIAHLPINHVVRNRIITAPSGTCTPTKRLVPMRKSDLPPTRQTP